MATGEIIALTISVIAIITSLISLWMNSLSPFRLRITNDSPTFSAYKITPSVSGNKEGKTWWIPSFDMAISFYNTGRRPGEILDIRIVAELKSRRTTKKSIFYPKWIVNYSAFQQYRANRFEWIDKAVIREWYPILLKGESETHLHLILESDRWEYAESGTMNLELEIATSDKKWRKYRGYSLSYRDDIFDIDRSYTAYSDEVEGLREL